MTSIGFVGLGGMGSRMATRLLDGNQVYGTNRTRAKAADLIGAGLIWRDTPREVAAVATVIISMVTDDAALAAITTGPDGILAGLAPGDIYLDMSTVSPEASRSLARQAGERGAVLLDAPVSGSLGAASDGTLAIMASGDEAAFRSVEPLLRRLGSTVTYVGGGGRALLLKLAINLSLASQMLAFGEGMLLARRGGIEPELAAEVIAGSAVGSPMLRARVPLVLDPPEQPWFDLRLMHKDIGLVRRAARDLGIVLPSALLADEVLAAAEELGYGQRDIAVLPEVLEQTDGHPPAVAPVAGPVTR